MTDSSDFNLSSVGRLLQRRVRKTKLFWLSCVPSKKGNLRKSVSTVRDGQTQTTPTFKKTLSVDAIFRAEDLQVSPESCVVGSSRNILDSDSDVFMGSFDSFDNPNEGSEIVDSNALENKASGICKCQCLDELGDLRQEINQLRATVSSLKYVTDAALKPEQSVLSVPPPPPPMPPPPPPPFPSPFIHHSFSLNLPRRRRSVPKMHSDEMMQDRGKPIITLEELKNGWGCGYRTLQTLCSWILRCKSKEYSQSSVPSIPEIQKILVDIEDKPENFYGSRDWIGSVEVGYVLNKFNVDFRILHITGDCNWEPHVKKLTQHFQEGGCPVMMGGKTDAAAKCVVGTYLDDHLLIVDPHLTGKASKTRKLVQWHSTRDFSTSHQSFYNLCIPLLKWQS
ncbi:Ufm1-specific protease 2 [Frankliniella fusca]|uniref:Ufm1-specific protease 2 n=1 Tax=Frankliniella fusca TaxID=407009 RepID=A0AAE1LZ07_9NEOP|nr:Ufm1-specific protease 2 [Frankliniella fusca]